MGNMDGMIETLIGFGIFIGLCVFGAYLLVNKYFINHDIKVSKPLIPTIELVIKNNKVDTLYVYKIK